MRAAPSRARRARRPDAGEVGLAVEVEIDPAHAEPVVAVAETTQQLLVRHPAVERVADAALAAAEAAADAVELEMDVAAANAAAVAPAFLGEGRRRTAERQPGAVLGRGAAEDEDVGRRAALPRLLAAVAHRVAHEHARCRRPARPRAR